MTKTVRIHETGGEEVLRVEDCPVPAPAAGEVLIRHEAIGVNFIDIYYRTGLYSLPQLPATLGMEGAGIVEELGSGVEGLTVGDRVAYAMAVGSYAERRVIPADKLVKLPDTIDSKQAAAMMLRGMTVRYLLKSSYPVSAGDKILLMAAAGGVGLMLTQWAKHLGAEVIGCVGGPEKAERARANGCDHVIDYKSEDIASRVREITNGEGVPVSYDSVGQATMEASLDSLRPTGVFVTFGNASGPITNFNLGLLAAKGSLYVQRPSLGTYIRTPDLLRECAQDLFDMVRAGAVKVEIGQTYQLDDVARAHADMVARRTTGSTVLLP